MKKRAFGDKGDGPRSLMYSSTWEVIYSWFVFRSSVSPFMAIPLLLEFIEFC